MTRVFGNVLYSRATLLCILQHRLLQFQVDLPHRSLYAVLIARCFVPPPPILPRLMLVFVLHICFAFRDYSLS